VTVVVDIVKWQKKGYTQTNDNLMSAKAQPESLKKIRPICAFQMSDFVDERFTKRGAQRLQNAKFPSWSGGVSRASARDGVVV